MDRIAAQGFRFRNAFVVNSLCSPSRAAFLTGRYNHLNGVANNHTPFPLTNTTYATLLRAAGYRTGYFGKWHMGTQQQRPGFDEHASFVGQGRYFDMPFLVNGVQTPTTGWVDDVSTSYAVQFIHAYAGQPFLAHLPTTPPQRLEGHFSSATLTAAPNAASYAPYDPSPNPAVLPAAEMRNYFRTLVGVDQNVGRVLDVLAQAGIANDTVVIFASDTGYFLGEHAIPGAVLPGDKDGNKRNAYEESVRIPLLLRW